MPNWTYYYRVRGLQGDIHLKIFGTLRSKLSALKKGRSSEDASSTHSTHYDAQTNGLFALKSAVMDTGSVNTSGLSEDDLSGKHHDYELLCRHLARSSSEDQFDKELNTIITTSGDSELSHIQEIIKQQLLIDMATLLSEDMSVSLFLQEFTVDVTNDSAASELFSVIADAQKSLDAEAEFRQIKVQVEIEYDDTFPDHLIAIEDIPLIDEQFPGDSDPNQKEIVGAGMNKLAASAALKIGRAHV